MPHRQIILFSILLAISITFLSLGEHTKLIISTHISSVLLFPVKTITSLLDFLSVSRTRITELETIINRLRLENAEQKKMITLDTTEYKNTMYTLSKAQIIGRDPSNINGYVYINLGSKHGLCNNQPVISADGLIGRTKYVSPNHTIVETLENNGFAVSAIDANTGVHGIVKNRENLLFDFIRIDDEINLGDSIYTSGMSDFFPAGILIGTVKKIEISKHLFFKPVFVKPSVRINRINYVYIVHGTTTATISDKEENIKINQPESGN